MPIVDAHLVAPAGEPLPAGTARAIADAVAGVLGAAPGRVWVRLHALPDTAYAENGEADPVHPVFLDILHADAPPVEQRAREAAALSQAVAAVLGRPAGVVHVVYAAAGRGRVAFGGRLLT